MASGKWTISGRSVAQNYQSAAESFAGEKQLVGLLVGNPKLSRKYITGVVFVEETNEGGLKEKAEEVLSYLSADLELLGLAKFPTSQISLDTINLNESPEDDPTLLLKLPTPEELKQRNFKKLFDSNPQVVPEEDAAQWMKANGLDRDATQTLRLSFEFKFDMSATNEEFRKFAHRLADMDFIDSESSVTIGKIMSSAMQKVGCKSGEVLSLRPTQSILSSADLNTEKQVPFTVNLAIHASKSICDAELRKLIIQQVERIFYQAKLLLSSEKDGTIKSLYCDVFAPSVGSFPIVHIVTPSSKDIQETNSSFVTLIKKRISRSLNLSAALPNFLPSQSLLAKRVEIANLLTNPHESVKYPIKPQRIAIVSGRYQYHHYMQDNFDDSGWGCAYRSFQTVWSWFRLQHLTDKPIPSHRQIQQCLVDIEDKPPKFVGSRQWIGSLELSFCLETMIGVSSRILSSKTGTELGEHGRAIIFHFENYGSPIMIGGGQLAHTILGIDYNVRSGESRFLVLDPHYTGNEDIDVIVEKGWCSWKPMSFWDKKAFYNLLLPITPKADIRNETC